MRDISLPPSISEKTWDSGCEQDFPTITQTEIQSLDLGPAIKSSNPSFDTNSDTSEEGGQKWAVLRVRLKPAQQETKLQNQNKGIFNGEKEWIAARPVAFVVRRVGGKVC